MTDLKGYGDEVFCCLLQGTRQGLEDVVMVDENDGGVAVSIKRGDQVASYRRREDPMLVQVPFSPKTPYVEYSARQVRSNQALDFPLSGIAGNFRIDRVRLYPGNFVEVFGAQADGRSVHGVYELTRQVNYVRQHKI